MKIPQLIVSDIDGVIAVDGVPDNGTIKTLIKLTKQGMLCTVATGRGYYRYAMCMRGNFTPNIPIILENGGRICSPRGRTLYTQPIDKNTYTQVEQFMTSQYVSGMGFFQLSNKLYVKLEYSAKYNKVSSFLPEKYIAGSYDTLPAFLHHLHQSKCCVIAFLPLPNTQLPFPKTVNWTKNDRNYMVMEQGVSKADALLRLCNIYGIPLNRVLVAGNDHNDEKLFTLPVQWKIAVGDACPNLLKHASHTVANPQSFGEFLHQFVQ